MNLGPAGPSLAMPHFTNRGLVSGTGVRGLALPHFPYPIKDRGVGNNHPSLDGYEPRPAKAEILLLVRDFQQVKGVWYQTVGIEWGVKELTHTPRQVDKCKIAAIF